MKLKRYLPMLLWAILILSNGSGMIAGTALPPQEVVGPSCPPGGKRQHSTMVFEDRDGDGTYDYWIKYFCNGKANQGSWNPNEQIDWDESDGTPLGELPAFPGGPVYIEMTIDGTDPLGRYIWTIREKRVSDNAVVAETVRHPNGDMTYTVLLTEAKPDDEPGLGLSD